VTATLCLIAMLSLGATAPAGQCAPPVRGEGDGLTMRLHLTVEVTNLEGKPLADISIRFLDTAPSLGSRGPGLSLGTSDSKGRLDRHVTYTWPDYWNRDRRPDSGTFDILVGDDVVHGTVECLPVVADERRLVVRVAVFDGIIIE
jgi:hypothetical protein